MKKVTIYSSSTCAYCVTAKDYFKEIGVEYEEKNVSTDVDARKELMAKGHMGVPVIIIDEEEIVGFDKVKIDAALAE